MRLRKRLCSAILCVSLLQTSAFPAHAAFSAGGKTAQNRFSIAAVERFLVTLSPSAEGGNGALLRLRWYEEKDGVWLLFGKEKSLRAEEAEENGAISFYVSFRENNRRFRYELQNEAGIILSQSVTAAVSPDGSSVVFEEKAYGEDLSLRKEEGE